MITFKITIDYNTSIKQGITNNNRDININIENINLNNKNVITEDNKPSKEFIEEVCINIYNQIFFSEYDSNQIRKNKIYTKTPSTYCSAGVLLIIVGYFISNYYSLRETSNYLCRGYKPYPFQTLYNKMLEEKNGQVLIAGRIINEILSKVTISNLNLYGN